MMRQQIVRYLNIGCGIAVILSFGFIFFYYLNPSALNSFAQIKTINVNGDKSLSIRWALLASQAEGKSRAYNLLKSLDVLSTFHF